jgi:hypothetical protein
MPNAAVASSGRMSSALVALAALGIVLLSAAATLWVYYGTTVFYEMIVAGLAYCF